jgi:hypothetical protein
MPQSGARTRRKRRVRSNRRQLDQGLAFGDRTHFADKPSADPASLLGHDRYMHLHRFDDANLGVGLNAVTDLDQASDELSGDRRSDLA